MERYLGEHTPKLGFGLMRLPKNPSGGIDLAQTISMVDRFMEAGQTYFDTAYLYDGGESERTAKAAIVDRYPRDSFTLATKLNAWIGRPTEEQAKDQLRISLERTGAGYFDYYLLHGVEEANLQVYNEYGLWDYVREQKAKGLIRHWGFSFHGGPEMLDGLLATHPDAEFVQLQINYADWENPYVAARANYEIARKHAVPVVIMEPVKGGALSSPPPAIQDILRTANPDASFASWAMRFAAGLDGVITVLSGMSSLEQVEDNIRSVANLRVLTDAEQEVIQAARAALSEIPSIPCTGCRYCMSGCPMEIPIPDIFSARNMQMIWGLDDRGRMDYARSVGTGNGADACVRCGQCESACPQHLKVPDYLADCAAHLIS